MTSNENPYAVSASHPPSPPTNEAEKLSDSQVLHNITTDTLTGLNLRKWDNLFQVIFISIAAIVSTVGGAVLAWRYGGKELPWQGGALIGAFIGTVTGLFASGIILMFIRFTRHIQGKHD